MSTTRQRADSASVLLALRVTPWVRVLSLHVTVTINSSLALGDNMFRPKRLAERLIASIVGTAVTSLWTALACDVGGRKNLAKRQGTYWQALARARARFPGKFPCRKNPPRNCVFVNEDGYPYLVQI
jgi:hypothetical protein